MRLPPRPAAVAFAALAACGPSTVPSPQRAPLLDDARAIRRQPATAEWQYHPAKAAPLAAEFELGARRALYAGGRGERWLIDGDRATPASSLAPEPLVAILRAPSSGWLFLGQSGTSYEAAEPLGPFRRASAPLDALAVVSAANDAILGVRMDGRLVRSADGGATWNPLEPAAQRFVDVAVDRDGTGLALAIPEALFETRDAGVTWRRVDAPTFGARGFARDKHEGLTIQSAWGARRWKREGASEASSGADADGGAQTQPAAPRLAPSAVPGTDAPPVTVFEELGRDVVFEAARRVTVPRGPNAAALATGHAIVLGGVYVEVVRKPDSRDGWELVTGPFGARLEARALDLGRTCGDLRLSGFGQSLWLACLDPRVGDTHDLDLLHSADFAKTIVPTRLETFASLAAFRMVAGRNGALVLSGVCGTKVHGCSARGLFHRRLMREPAKRVGETAPKQKVESKRAQWEIGPSATPSLHGVADALAVSSDGAVVVAVGRRAKGRTMAAFISHDGGATFIARDLDSDASNAGVEGEPGAPVFRGADAAPRLPAVSVSTLAPGEDGTIAIGLASGATRLIVIDDQGRTLSRAALPNPHAVLGAVGARALAVHPTLGDAWQSLDAGTSWEPIDRAPVAPCGNDACTATVFCLSDGCVIGDEVTRVGWRGRGRSLGGVLGPLDGKAGELHDRVVGTVVSCTLDDQPWRRLALESAPTAGSAVLGDLSWYAAVVDEKAATATAVHARARGKVEHVPLLAPIPRAEAHAFTYRGQIQGGVAMRYALPAIGSRITNVDVAWDDALAGRVGRARIPDAGPLRVGDATHGPSAPSEATPARLSIVPGGAIVSIHRHAGDSQTSWFVDGRSVEAIPPVQWPHGAELRRRSEITRVAGQSVAITTAHGEAALLRGRRSKAGFSFDSLTLALPNPSAFGLNQVVDFTYAAGAPGLVVTTWTTIAPRARSTFHAIRADGDVVAAPVPVPTQLHLGDTPRACTKRERADTPRVVAQFLPGTRHPILVMEANEPVRVLMSNRAVLHGTPAEPCAAAFDAASAHLGDDEIPSSALLVMDDLEHSWIFRPLASQGVGVEYRTMTCHFDPTAEAPIEVFGMDGTLVRRR